MASVDLAKRNEGKLINFLRETLKVDNEVINCFVQEKIDERNVKLLTENQLKELGITALGDRILLRDSFSNSEKPEEVSREEKLEPKIEQAGPARLSKRPNEEAGAQDDPPTKKTKRPEKENLKFQFEWKHWNEKKDKYVRKSLQQGGGVREFEVPRNASLDECEKIALGFFFPDGESCEGSQTSMIFELADFKGDVFDDSFIASEYKCSSGLAIPKIYLLSEKVKESFFDKVFPILVKKAIEWSVVQFGLKSEESEESRE